MRNVELLIAGAGPAGCATAIQCTRLGLRPVLLDETGQAGGLIENAFLIENYPGLEFPISGSSFASRLRNQLRNFDLHVEHGRVDSVRLEHGGWHAETSQGPFSAKAVVIASGTAPLRAGIRGEDVLAGELLFYDVVSLLARIPGPKSVAVTGSGEAACDYSRSLGARGAAVHLLVRGNELHAQGHLRNAVCNERSVRIHYGCTCVQVTAFEGRCELSLRGLDGSPATLSCIDAVLVAVGRESRMPNNLSNLASPPASPPGLWIIGDARRGMLGQLAIACGDGLLAAAEAARFLET